jgi:hypothetical protein
VRPRKQFLEVCVFSGGPSGATRAARRSIVEDKARHIIRITHRDEVEPPITDWLREAYELQDVLASAGPKKKSTRTSK